MNYLKGAEEKEAITFFKEAARVARSSTCLRAKCGSVIVKNGEIISEGYNSPPLNDIKQRRCLNRSVPPGFKSDKTCCIHAEQRAIINALKDNPDELAESRIYFARLDNKGNIKRSGRPYCTICSKMSLDVAISEFALWHTEGVCIYNTDKYNKLSFKYNGK